MQSSIETPLARGPVLTAPIARKPSIETRLGARIVLASKSPADYSAFRFGLTFKGYRRFSIVYTGEEMARALEAGPPDMVLVSSAFEPDEQRAIAELVGRFHPGYDRLHGIEAPEIWGTGAAAPPQRVEGSAIRHLDHIPINVEIELTSRCNARCVFCPIDKMERLDRTITDERLAGILEACRVVQPALVYLCGVGEPLLYRSRGPYRDIVGVVAAISREIGCPVGVNTNGELLTPDLFQRLLDAGVSMVNVSVNGVTEEVYGRHMRNLTHAKVSHNVEQAVRIRPEAVSLQGVITQGNHHEIAPLVRHWRERGVRIFTFNQCSNKSGFLDQHDSLWFDDLPALYAQLADPPVDAFVAINSCNFPMVQTEFLCRVPVNFISVDVDGNILHCMHDFASVTEYGKFEATTAANVRDLMRRRIMSRVSLCDGCNAPKHDVNQVLWNGHKLVERTSFGEFDPWEQALERLGPHPGSARAGASPPAA